MKTVSSFSSLSRRTAQERQQRLRPQTGFTIVELLIVIVVIGILAAIVIVAYNGIQNRANDAVIQSDLNSFAKMISIYQAENGTYPPGGGIYSGGTSTGDSTLFPGITFRASKASYRSASSNLFYCTGKLAGADFFSVEAQSKSGVGYIYRSDTGGISTISPAPWNSSQVCADLGMTQFTHSYGYYSVTKTWYSWVQD